MDQREREGKWLSIIHDNKKKKDTFGGKLAPSYHQLCICRHHRQPNYSSTMVASNCLWSVWETMPKGKTVYPNYVSIQWPRSPFRWYRGAGRTVIQTEQLFDQSEESIASDAPMRTAHSSSQLNFLFRFLSPRALCPFLPIRQVIQLINSRLDYVRPKRHHNLKFGMPLTRRQTKGFRGPIHDPGR